MSDRHHMGLIGLGVMGRNLALNMADEGISVVAWDPWDEARDCFASAIANEAGGSAIRVAATPRDLVAGLPTPRTLLVMVKAGEPVDAVIETLRPLLAAGDALIDGGNSHYPDTIRREAALREAGLHFIGLGVSGGEEGARHGPSLMAGGDPAAYERARPILEAMAARFDGAPCCALVGPDGAGHFVKMVHNGIEYGIMQLIAEAYALLHDLGGIGTAAMAALFREWNGGELASYLVGITATILERRDDLTGAPLVEMILDKAEQKGTGRWSSEAALEIGMPTPTITEAVFARVLAGLKDQRLAAAGALSGPPAGSAVADPATFAEAVRQALLGATVATYAQGLALIAAAGRERGWTIAPARVAAIWRAGCIIKADLLDAVMQAFEGEEAPANLMCAPRFAGLLAGAQAGWRDTVAAAVRAGIAVPGLGSALAYYDGYRTPRSSANLIQAQRDFFGAHTYERLDRPGTFHTAW